MDMIAADDSASQVSDKIKDLLFAKSAEKVDEFRPTVANSLEQALDALDSDRDFLTKGDVFTNDMIDGYIEIKEEEVSRLNNTPHPVEFDMYYAV